MGRVYMVEEMSIYGRVESAILMQRLVRVWCQMKWSGGRHGEKWWTGYLRT